MKEEIEVSDATLNAVVRKERILNQEVSDASAMVLKVYKHFSGKGLGLFPLKTYGSISELVNRLPQSKVTYLDDNFVRNPKFDPFIRDSVTGQRQVDWSNQTLDNLSLDFSKEVVNAVLHAVEELLDHNPSGRYPYSVPWNITLKRPMSLAEVIESMGKHISNNKV